MNKTVLIGHLLVPAIVVVTIALTGSSMSTSEWAIFLVVNYIFYSLPHWSWLGVAQLADVSIAARHAGYIGANIALIALFVVFECCLNNANALGWFYYYPIALASILLLAGVTSKCRNKYGKLA